MEQEALDTLVFILEDNQENRQVQEDNQPGQEHQEVREVPVGQEAQAVPVDQEALDTQVDIREANQESRQVQDNQLGQE